MTVIVQAKTFTRRIITHQVTLDGTAIRELLRQGAGQRVPVSATVTVMIPRGGDYSGMKLDIDGDMPVIVHWTEQVEEK